MTDRALPRSVTPRGLNRVMLRMPDLVRTVGLARPTIYRLIKAGDFPAPIKLTERAVAWPSDRVQAWMDARCGTDSGTGGDDVG